MGVYVWRQTNSDGVFIYLSQDNTKLLQGTQKKEKLELYYDV